MRKILLLIILSVLTQTFIFSQKVESDSIKKNTNIMITFSYQNGYVLPTNDFVRGINAERDTINAFQNFSLKFIKQTHGNKLWEQLYNYPEYGIGIYVADFYNPEEIGAPIAFYGYFSSPFHRWNKFVLNFEAGLGITFNWKKYSPANPYNIATGASATSYIDLGLKAEYQLSNKFFVDLGFSLSHFSNGRLKEPNFGFNTLAPRIGLKYKFNDNRIKFNEQIVPKFTMKNEMLISGFFGFKNIMFDSLNVTASEKFEGVFFPVVGISTLFNRQITYKSKIGFGFDVCYDASVDAQIAVDNGEIEYTNNNIFNNIQFSIFPSYELVINKVSLLLQPSFYVFRQKLNYQSPVFYQRIGLRYNFYNKFYLGVSLRAFHFHTSDFIEWSFAYRIF